MSVIIAHDAQTGIQRVVRAIWAELLKLNGTSFDLVPVFATAREGYRVAPLDFLDRSSDIIEGEVLSAGAGDHFLGLDLAAHLLPKYRGQIRSFRSAGTKVHIVVYDLLPLLSPQWFTAPAVRHFTRWWQTLLEVSDTLLCISAEVRRNVQDQLRASGLNTQLRVGIVPMGGDIAASKPSHGRSKVVTSIIARARVRPTIMMVGTIEPRKGYGVALTAFESLWTDRSEEAPDLVIVGRPGWKTKRLQDRILSHPELNGRLHWLTDVSDEDLCRLYEGCRGVLMCSFGEGMGLPVLEAALYQRPVLARDLSVFRETGLPNLSFFVDDSPRALGDAIVRLAHSSRTLPPPRLASWSDSVRDLLGNLGLSQCEAATRSGLTASLG